MTTNPGTAWKPMSTAPRNGLILLKAPIDGGHWPVVGRYSHIHGGFCTPPILGQTECQLFPSAWAEIPAYDGNAHV
jgi:hypothetical protein